MYGAKQFSILPIPQFQRELIDIPAKCRIGTTGQQFPSDLQKWQMEHLPNLSHPSSPPAAAATTFGEVTRLFLQSSALTLCSSSNLPALYHVGKDAGLTSLRSSYSKAVILKTHPAALLAPDYNSSWQINSLRHFKLSVTKSPFPYLASKASLQLPEVILLGYLGPNSSKMKIH